MAWTTPKIDSIAADGLDYAHLNKIEANLKFLAGGNDTIAQSTDAATANALAKRNANADIAFRDVAVRDVNASGNVNGVNVNASGNVVGNKIYSSSVADGIHASGFLAGDVVIDTSATIMSVTNTSYAMKKRYRTRYSGTLRIIFGLREIYDAGETGTVYGKIYKNGSPYGTERSTTATSEVTYAEDLAFADGDVIEIWAMKSGYRTGQVMTFTIASSDATIHYGFSYP